MTVWTVLHLSAFVWVVIASQSAISGLVSVPMPPHPITISAIPATAGRVKGPTLDDFASGSFDLGPETIRTSRKRADAPAQPINEYRTAWGLHRFINPRNSGADTLTFTFSGHDQWRSTLVFKVMSKHECRAHTLENWMFLDGQAKDCTLNEAFNDVRQATPVSATAGTIRKLRDQARTQQARADGLLDAITPARFSMQHVTDASGVWAILAATIEDSPGYSYTVSRLSQVPGRETHDEKAIGAATLMVVGLLLDLTIYELENNQSLMTTFDTYFVKVLLDILINMVAHAVQSITESGGHIESKVTLIDVQLALGQLGRGSIEGPEVMTRFLSTERFHLEVNEDLDCIRIE